jgi:hypothetical protein
MTEAYSCERNYPRHTYALISAQYSTESGAVSGLSSVEEANPSQQSYLPKISNY